MAFTDLGSLGATGATSNNQSSLALTCASAVSVGNLIVVVVACDNTATVDGPDKISVVQDSGGNYYFRAGSFANGQGAAQAGASVEVWYAECSRALTTSSTITATFVTSANADATAMTARFFSFDTTKGIAIEGTPATRADDAADPGSLDVTTANIECLRIRGIASEVGNNTNLTPTSGWTAWANGNSATSGTIAEMCARAEHIISTATGAASDPTYVAADTASLYVALKEISLTSFGSLLGTFVSNAATTTTTVDAVGSVSVSVGDLIIAHSVRRTTSGATGCTDNLGNTYTAQNAGTNTGSATYRAFYSIATVAGTLTTVSVSFVAGNTVAVCAAVFKGFFGSIDANPANTTDNATPFVTNLTGTLTSQPAVVVSWVGGNDFTTDVMEVASPDTIAVTGRTLQGTGSAVECSIAYRVVSATTSVSASFNKSDNTNFTGCAQGIMSFPQGTPPVPQGAAWLAGTGDLEITSNLLADADAKIDGAGDFEITSTIRAVASSNLSGAGSLAVNGFIAKFGAASFAGAGEVDAIGSLLVPAQASLNGTGALNVDGTVPSSFVGEYDETGTVELFNLDGTKYTEFEFGLQIDPSQYVPGDVLTFRVYKDGSPLSNYPINVTITIPAAGNTFDGAALFAGTGRLNVDSFIAKFASISLAGTGGFVVTGRLLGTAATSFTGTGALNVDGFIAKFAAASMQGAGALAASATLQANAAANLAGAGKLSVDGFIAKFASASFAGTGALNAVGSLSFQASASFVGTGGLVAPVTTRAVAAASLAGSGQLNVDVSKQFASISLSGAGALAVNATVLAATASSFAGAGALNVANVQLLAAAVANLAGAGQLKVDGFIAKFASVLMAGTGALNATAVASFGASLSLSGAGQVSSAGTLLAQASALLGGTGGFAGDALISHPGGTLHQGAAGFNGSGGLNVAGALRAQASASFAGTGALNVVGSIPQFASALFNGAGQLKVDGFIAKFASASLAGTGNVSVATPALLAAAAANLSGIGQLSVNGFIAKFASASLAGTGALNVSPSLQALAAASLAGGGQLNVNGFIAKFAAVALAGSGAFNGIANILANAQANLAGTGALNGNAVIDQTKKFGSASLAGTGALSVNATRALAASASLNGASDLQVRANQIHYAAASFKGEGGLDVKGTVGVEIVRVPTSGQGRVPSGGDVRLRSTSERRLGGPTDKRSRAA